MWHEELTTQDKSPRTVTCHKAPVFSQTWLTEEVCFREVLCRTRLKGIPVSRHRLGKVTRLYVGRTSGGQ